MARSSAIVELMTRSHGRHLGLVRGGAGSRMRPLLQPGNTVNAVWRARLDEHLGYYALEGTKLRAAAMFGSPHAVYGVTHLASLVRLLPERDPHEDIYEMVEAILDDFENAGEAGVHLIRFELTMLTELGFGLDLSACVATGTMNELVYVSPKSGAAVSRQAGEPWRDRLLRLPPFLQEGSAATNSWTRSGSGGRLPADGDVPAAECSGAAGTGTLRCPRGVYRGCYAASCTCDSRCWI